MKKKTILMICLLTIFILSCVLLLFSNHPKEGDLLIYDFDYRLFRTYSHFVEDEAHNIYVCDSAYNITQIFPEGAKRFIVLDQFKHPFLCQSEGGFAVMSGMYIYDYDKNGHYIGQRDCEDAKILPIYHVKMNRDSQYRIYNSAIHSSVVQQVTESGKTQTRVILWALKPVVLHALLACVLIYWGVRKLSALGGKLEKYFDR